MNSPVFPFSAVVGQEPMKLALLLAAVNPSIGGVLIRGERGTAKSTAARGLAALLPSIRVVEGCACSCDPDDADGWCDECLGRRRRGEQMPPIERPAPFVDLPVSATEDRVVGSFDLEAALRHGTRRFQPGLLASAHRGILYVDEVNLLDDHVVDLLLDVAATGVNVVEREGITHRHPARFVLVGTMNPEEGELRPQLLDRFGLCVDVTAAAGNDERVAILERCLAFDRNPAAMCRQWAGREEDLSARLASARRAVGAVAYGAGDLPAIAALAGGLDLAGHRAEIVILRAACASAALEGRRAIDDSDILRVAPLGFRHRLSPDAFTEGSPTISASLADLAVRLEVARDGVPSATEKKTSRVTG
jgi:Mg-chelatase subunit ChlI